MDPRKGNAEEEKPREENSETVAKRVVQSSTKNQKQKAKDDSMEHCKDPDDDLQKLKAKAGISKMVTETEQATAGGSMADWCGPSMAHEGGKGVECSSSSAAFRDLLSLKRCRFIGGLSVNEVLPDDILVQILCRLPRQSAMASKIVCKHWLALISTPNFISCFIKEHHRAHQQEKYRILKADSKYLFLTLQTPNSDISFSFLPSTESSSSNSRKSKVTILASSDDLFLCLSFLSTIAYFICNPFTKEWFDLPPPPPTSCHRGHAIVFGFTHKPYYHVEQGSEQKRVLVNSRCRFSVVRLNSPLKEASNFEIDTFSSETWEWTTSMLQHSSSPCRPSSISRNGLLYWLCNITGRVIIHDPYNHKVCYVVEESPGFPGWYGFNVSQGSLFLFDIYPSFRVWELEDEDRQPKWSLHLEYRILIDSKDPDDDLQKLKAKAGISKMVTETEQATAGGSMADCEHDGEEHDGEEHPDYDEDDDPDGNMDYDYSDSSSTEPNSDSSHHEPDFKLPENMKFIPIVAGKEVKCEGEILFDKDEQIGVVRRPRGVKTIDEFERAIDNKCVRLIRILSAWYQSSRKKYVNNFEVEYLSTDELKEERDPLNWVHKVKLLDIKVVINRRFS